LNVFSSSPQRSLSDAAENIYRTVSMKEENVRVLTPRSTDCWLSLTLMVWHKESNKVEGELIINDGLTIGVLG